MIAMFPIPFLQPDTRVDVRCRGGTTSPAFHLQTGESHTCQGKKRYTSYNEHGTTSLLWTRNRDGYAYNPGFWLVKKPKDDSHTDRDHDPHARSTRRTGFGLRAGGALSCELPASPDWCVWRLGHLRQRHSP